mgnify:CR=1 FL=1
MLDIKRISPISAIILAVTAFLVALALVKVSDVQAAGNTFYVSNISCSPAGPGSQAQPYCTIQQAVNAAGSGDTIKVDKGTYNDPVNVPKTLTLLGHQANNSALNGRNDPAKETKVNAGGSNGMSLAATTIVAKGFSFLDNPAGPAMTTSKDFSGYVIMNNIFSGNVFGLYLNSAAENLSEISRNRFNNNNQPGAASGNGIYSDQGAKNARIHHNLFKSHNNAALILVSTATAVNHQDLRVDHNSFDGSGTMFLLVNGQRIAFDHNQGWGFVASSAVFLGGSNSDVTVSHNSLRGDTTGGTKNAYSGIRINVDQPSYGTADLTLAPNTNIKVHHNNVRDFGDGGVSVGNSDGTTATLTNSSINHNVLRNNGNGEVDYDAGILIRAGNSGNVIHNNVAKGNNPKDAVDNSTGSGTLGTANSWHHNNCATSTPAGLCAI